MTPTDEQLAIIEAARTTSDNLLINALAGAAKTTSLELICRAVTGIPILSLAFNKRIADELSKRLPSHVECRTMNSLGHRVWSAYTGRRLVVASDKTRNILRSVIDELPARSREEAWEDFADTMQWISRAKRDGYVPPSWRGPNQAIYSSQSVWISDRDHEDPSNLQSELIDEVLRRSIAAAYEGGIDFDDQIYMPCQFGGKWPTFPLVLIDEAQDLNPLQHEMLAKLVGDRRIIAVGDPWQSIYNFRGAVSNGMTAMKSRWNMRELSLSMTFRVPRLGVERAWNRVPHFRARPGAPDGQILNLQEWSADDIPNHSAIICRNNAPLLSLGFKLLHANRSIKLVGMDIGAGLVRTMRKLGPVTMTGPQTQTAISSWMERELQRARKTSTVYDRAECLRALCEGRETLGAAISHAENLFKQDGPIQLLSGHKAKGLEWDTVFHLDPWRIPSQYAKEGTEAWEQEMNVRYVIETRFKENLFLVDMEGWNG